jgi:hypothetical protein
LESSLGVPALAGSFFTKWGPPKGGTPSARLVPDGHALRSLKRETPARSVADMTRDIPADKLEKLSEMLEELKEGGEDTNNRKDASNDA